MRLAIAGKGGAGKTTISAGLVRVAARTGRSVVAIDADTNPNLAPALGFDLDAVAAVPILSTSLVSRRFDGPALNVSLDDVLAAHATTGPDGIRLVRMGLPDHTQEGCLCSAHAVGAALLADLGNHRDVLTVMDLEASPEHLSRGTARHADVLVFVAEPYFRSLEAVRLQTRLARELPGVRLAAVANKVRDSRDAEAIHEFVTALDLPLLATVPWSDDVLLADRDRRSVIDVAPGGPVVSGIAALLAALDALDPVGFVGFVGFVGIVGIVGFVGERTGRRGGCAMCVGVPVKVVEAVDPVTKQAVVEANGVRRRVDMSLVVDDDGGGVAVGDWVLLHVGFAMSILDEDEAQKTLELLRLLGGDDADFAAFTSGSG